MDLAARRGILDIHGEIEEIADDLADNRGLMQDAINACVRLSHVVAGRFEQREMEEHEQLFTVANNLELILLYLASSDVRANEDARGGADIARFTRLPLSNELGQQLSVFLNESMDHLIYKRDSRSTLARQGQALQAAIAKDLYHVHNLGASRR